MSLFSWFSRTPIEDENLSSEIITASATILLLAQIINY